MNKRNLTYIPRVLTILLILSILAVTLSIVYNQKPPAHSIDNDPISGDNNNDDNDDDDDDENEKDQEDQTSTPEPYYTQFPKLAIESDEFLFFQSIEGYGDVKIKNIH